MRRVVQFVGASCCCLALGVAAANAESSRLSEAELDRVVAGFTDFPPIGGTPIVEPTTPPAPLFPTPTDGGFDIPVGLLNPPAPLPPVQPTPTPTPPDTGTPSNPPPTTTPPAPTYREQLSAYRQSLRSRF